MGRCKQWLNARRNWADTRFGFVWLNCSVLIQALHEKYAKQKGQTRFRAQEQENSLACPEPGKGHVYLLQTTGSSKISNGQLTSICQWFPGRNNCAPPPLPATRVSRTAQGTFQESKELCREGSWKKSPGVLQLLLVAQAEVLSSSPAP